MPNVVANPQFFDRDKDGNINPNNQAGKLGGVVSTGSNGTNGKIEGSWSWDIGGNPIKEVVTTTPGKPIITTTTEALNFENGVLKIPANTNKDPNTTSTTTFNIALKEGDAYFKNGFGVAAIGSDGKIMRVQSANPDGTITVNSEILKGATGLALVIVPDGLINPLFVPSTTFTVGESEKGGFQLIRPDGQRITGNSAAGADLLTSVKELNPRGYEQIKITGNRIDIEDVSIAKQFNRKSGEIGLPRTYDYDDANGKLTAKTENTTTTQTENVTREKIVNSTEPYAGFHGAVQTNGENVAAVGGAHIGVKKSDIKVNKDGEIVPDGGIRPFVEGQFNGGTDGTKAAVNVTGIAGANIGPAPSLERGVSGTVYGQGVVETDQEFQGNIAGRGNWSVAKDQTIFAQVKQGFVGKDDTTFEVGYEFNRTGAPYKPAAYFDKDIDEAAKKYLQENPNNKDGTLIKLTDGSVTPLATPDPQGAGEGKNGKIER
jgi:hypothetical protein